jgi:hypothetical protein
MTPRECFGLVLRVFGLVFIAIGLSNFYSTLTIAVMFRGGGDSLLPSVLFKPVFVIAAGIYLLRGAPHILRFAYPESYKN